MAMDRQTAMKNNVERIITRNQTDTVEDLRRASADLERMLKDITEGRRLGSCEINNVISTLLRAENSRNTAAAMTEAVGCLT